MSEARHAVVASGRLIPTPPTSRTTGTTRVARSVAAPVSASPEGAAASNEWFTGRLDAARAGDNAAFEDVYRATHPRLYRYAVSLVGREAEDITAEAWLQIARDLRGFVGDAQAFRGWAATIVRHRAMDQLRSAARRPVTLVETADLERPSDFDTAGRAAETMSTAAALELIATLPRDQAEAVILRAVVGLDAAAAAKVLGKRPGAVRVAAHRGLRALARRLEQEAPSSTESAGSSALLTGQ